LEQLCLHLARKLDKMYPKEGWQEFHCRIPE
jgi:hypothetical protein